MTLNGWQRLGVIASIGWILGAGAYTHGSVLTSFASVGSDMESACEEVRSSGDWNVCRQEFADEIDLGNREGWKAAALVSFAPVPLGWGFAFLILFLVRWVKRGFAV